MFMYVSPAWEEWFNKCMHYMCFMSFSCSAHKYWCFASVLAHFVGAVVGVMVYQLMIGYHLEKGQRGKQKKFREEEGIQLSDVTVSEDSRALYTMSESTTCIILRLDSYSLNAIF